MAASIRSVRPLLASIRKYTRISLGSIALLLLAIGMVFCAPASAQNTTISGNVYAPNGVDPLVNVLVYVTTSPVSTPVAGANCPGVVCMTAANAIPDGVTLYAYSAVDGSFTLSNIPVSTSYTLVIQAGKWQRQFLNVSVDTTPLIGLQLAMPTVHGTINTGSITSALPAAQTTGSVTTVNTIPLIAISTGSKDAMECVLRDVGIADSEFTDDLTATASTGGRIHLYQGDQSAGAYITSSTPNETALMGGTSATPLNDYDMVMFPCQGNTTAEPDADIESLIAYTSAGGRVFATHDSLVWLNAATSVPSGIYAGNTFSGAVNWLSTPGSNPPDGNATIDTGFTEGSTLAQWMLGVNASTTLGQVPLSTLRDNISSVVAPTQSWVTLNSPSNIMQVTFNTPVGADAADQYGRVLFNEYHVENGSANVAFPAECGTSPYSVADPAPLAASAMSAQEKMLEYSLFDLSNFVTAVVPPTASISITTNPIDGNFNEGDTTDTITANVTNTSSTVDLPANTIFTIALPAGVTATAMTDSTGGWSCTVGTLTCTRSATLGASTSDSVTVTVSVSSTATGGAASTSGTVSAQVASTNFSSNVTSPITIMLVQAAAVSWAAPAAITYGTALSGTQLDAVGNAPSGSYIYAPLAGAVLSAGSQTLSVTYTPDADYTSTYPGTGTASVTLVVNPAVATVVLSGLTQNYTGSPVAASAATIPVSLPVTLTYTGINPTIYGPTSTPPTVDGSYAVVATIDSGQNYTGTASGTMVISGVATPDATSTTVQVNPSPVMTGQPVTITATIADTTNPGTIPTGSVTFIDTTTGTALNGGSRVFLDGSGAATLTGVILNGTGAHTITAAYSGIDGTFAGGSNTAQEQVGLSSPVGTPLVSYPVTVTFTAAGLQGGISVLTQGAPNLDFTDAVEGDTCLETLPIVGQTCTVNVNFTPEYAGPRYGAVEVTDLDGNVLGTAYLQGTGTAPQVTFNPGTPSILPTIVDDVPLNGANDVTVDSSRNVYIADLFNSRIVKVPWSSNSYGTPIAIPLTGQSYNYANGMAVDGAGNLLVISYGELVELPWNGSSYGSPVVLLGGVTPSGVAVDGAGNVYVSDASANTVTEVPRTGSGYGSPSVLFSGLNGPAGLSVDGAGNVYVANAEANTVLEMPWTGSGYGAPVTVSNSLYSPVGIAVDAAGDVYIADTGNARAVVVPRIGSGFGEQAVLPPAANNPMNIATDELGNIFIANSNSVVELDVSDAPSLNFASTVMGATSSDSPQTMTVTNVGNAPLTFAGVSYAGDFPALNGAEGACSTSAQLAAGTGCTLPVNFTPTSTTGLLSESLVLTDNNLNATVAPGTQQAIALNGTAVEPAPVVTEISPAIGAASGGAMITITGTGFTGATSVSFGSAGAAGFLVNSDTSISAVSPAGIGTVDVTVATPGGTSMTSAADQFSYEQAQLILFAPPATGVAGNSLTLTATGGASGNPVIFSVVSGPATVSGTDGSTLTYTGFGAVVVEADQAGADGYAAAAPVQESIAVAPAPASYSVPTTAVGSTSGPQTIYVNFTTTGTLGSISVLTEGAANLDFTDAVSGDTCSVGTLYSAGTVCAVNVIFAPQYPGPQNGAVVLKDELGNLLASGYVNGVGTGPQITFANTTQGNLAPNSVNTLGGSFSFSNPLGMAIDASGNVFIADTGNHAVEEIPYTSGVYGAPIALGSSFPFNSPYGIAVDGAGNVFVSDIGNFEVYEILATGGYTTVNPLGNNTSNSNPKGIAVDGAGNVYVAGSNNAVYEILAAGGYTTVNELGGGFLNPGGVAVDGAGNIFVADNNNDAMKEMPAGCASSACVTPLASVGGPSSVAIDGAGDLYTTTGNLTEIPAGGGYTSILSLSSSASISNPSSIAVARNGNVFFINGNAVQEFDYADAPSLTYVTSTPLGEQDTTDGTQTVTAMNVGNAPLTFAGVSYAGDFPELNGAEGACSTGTPLAIGTGCTLPVTFAPTSVAGPLSESLSLTDNNLNATTMPGTQQTIALSGTALVAVAATQAVASTVLTQNYAAVAFTPVTGSGGATPLTYSVSPGLPTGLTMDANTGVISGTPTVSSAAANYTVTVTDANEGTAEASFSLTVNPAVVATQTVASTVLTQNYAAVAFTPVTGSGGTSPLTYSVSPDLPAGLMFNISTGAITGTPTGVSAAANYTVTVTDANGATAQASFSLTVNATVVATQAVASTVLTQNNAAVAFTPVTGSGGTSPLTYSVSPGLPVGLMLNTSTGAITGTPTVSSAAGNYTITVTDANGATAEASFSLTVNAAVVATQAIGTEGLTFYQAATSFTPVTGSGGTSPLTYSVSPGLPAGLVLDASTGIISGTPTAVSAAASYTVTVTDANGATAQASFSLDVAQQASVALVSATPTTSAPEQAVTLSVTVGPALNGTPVVPTGTVTFFNGATQLGLPVMLSGGTAQLEVSTLPPAQTAVITAVYSGDGNFLAVTSGNSASVVVGPLDFTFTNTGTSAYTAAPGAAASYSFALAPLYSDYAGTVSFTVTGLPAGATANFTPGSVAADGGAVPVTMTVQTASATAHLDTHRNSSPFGRGIVLALLLLPFGMKRSLREKLKGRMLLTVLLLAGMTAAVTGCGSNNGFMLQSPGTYTLTVTATSGTLQHSQTVTLIVQ